MSQKFHRTIIQIEVLSNEPYSFGNIGDINYDITEGECSGDYGIVKTEMLTKEQMSDALINQGSDPSFLIMD